MDIRELATWLVNADGNGASDEEFAETVILMHKIWKTGNPNVEITKEDMLEANTATIASHLKEWLDEIIFSTEMDPSCWWKDNTEE